MKRPFLLVWALLFAGIICLGQQPRAYWQSIQQIAVSAAGCSQATTFLARTSGLDATHQTAYTTLICGLVTDGNWLLDDAAYVHATADTTTALLSLPSATFNATAVSSPTFNADVGYTGNGTSSYIDSTFNPGLESSPKFTQDDASIWVFSNTSAASATSAAVGYGTVAAGSGSVYIWPRFTGDLFFSRLNSSAGAEFTTFSNSDGKGFYSTSRTSSTTIISYKNGSVGNTNSSTTSEATSNSSLTALAYSGGSAFWNGQVMAWGFGSKRDATQSLNLCKRYSAYMVTIAGISSVC